MAIGRLTGADLVKAVLEEYMRASFDRLEQLLAQAAKLLDEAAGEIRDLQLDSMENIRKIGELLAAISDIRLEIYKRRPDLAPDYFKEK